ncbi:hypothetical protein Tco_0268519 [Tanacetum coccineum]
MYKSKPMISKHYKKETDVKVGQNFENKEALDSSKIEKLDEVYQLLMIRSPQQIRGSPYESFEMLPYYCYNLERKNEGTVTRIKTDEKGVFEMLFIALDRKFVKYLRPLLIIDAHIKVNTRDKSDCCRMDRTTNCANLLLEMQRGNSSKLGHGGWLP